MTRWAVFGAGLLFALVVVAQVTAAQQAPAPPPERLGPFDLGPAPHRRLSVVASYKAPAGASLGAERTLASWAIRDGSDALLFQQIVEPERAPEQFASINVIERATVLHGSGRRFLFVEIGYLPSAPSGGSIYYVFGFDGRDKFRQMAKLVQNGKGILNAPDAAGRLALAQGRYLDLSVWTSWFEMTFRYSYDEARDAFVPRNQCSRVTDATFSRESLAELAAQQDNVVAVYARRADPTPRERIAMAPTVKVRLVQACVGTPPVDGSVDPETLMLLVRINGKEGWVGSSDFHRLGIQQAG